jgi:hypothetical protein
MPNPKPVLHANDHRPKSRLEDGTRGGADAFPGIDSTQNAGDWGVQSVDADGNAEAAGLVLAADGDGGTEYVSPMAGGDGIQFDTDPQAGNFLLATTTNQTRFEAENFEVAATDDIDLTAADQVILTGNDTEIHVGFSGSIYLQSDGGIQMTSTGTSVGTAVTIRLRAGSNFRLEDASGAALLLVSEAGGYAIRTGQVWQSSL